MSRSVLFLPVACFLALATPAAAEVQTHTYKKVDGHEMKLYLSTPTGWKASDKRPAIVFFFGGGWTNGNIKQFEPQAEYFAGRGLVTVRVDYRVKSRHNVTPDQCVEDALSAMRWVRQNAGKLGIDPDRIAASGGSAGGHLAAATATVTGLDAKGEDAKISARPNLLILYNPALLSPEKFQSRLPSLEMAKKIAPTEHMTKSLPPCIIFFGTKDALIDGGEDYVKKAGPLGLVAELHTADGQPHGFFNRAPWQERTTHQADLFLIANGWLKGEPTIKPSDEAKLKLAAKSTK
jgi:acetyl esterase/lipase